MNVTAYIIYILITYLVTVKVGLIFYRNGRLYILRLLHGNEKLTDSINHLLLIGYYLLNLGYASLMLSQWQTIHTITELLTSVVNMTGRIMVLLGIIHFFNMATIFIYSKKMDKNITHHKKTGL
ncbi:MAG TPA: hypothetical protein PKC72_08020 [Chitinophagaceae bacterium]|nr:hypothetical protein [Chitinophagaceae bacterium]